MIARVIILIVSFAFAVPFGVAGSKQKPILTDEFDRFLVTPETVIGEEVGKAGHREEAGSVASDRSASGQWGRGRV